MKRRYSARTASASALKVKNRSNTVRSAPTALRHCNNTNSYGLLPSVKYIIITTFFSASVSEGGSSIRLRFVPWLFFIVFAIFACNTVIPKQYSVVIGVGSTRMDESSNDDDGWKKHGGGDDDCCNNH